jgi:hypothetical protein
VLAAAPTLSGDAAVTPTPNRTSAKARLVALSPGLLGVSTGLREPPPVAKSSPDGDSSPSATGPLSIPDAELFEVDSKPPDSAVPIDSVDYVESLPPPVAPVDEPTRRYVAPRALASQAKRAPQAPPHPPQPPAAPVPENAEARRRRQPSGDLSDDFLSADLGFDPAPAIAPPDAAALMRKPLSSRPAPATGGAAVRPSAQSSTRAPVSKPNGASESKSGGRGLLFFLVAAAFGSAGYFWAHRLQPPAEPAAEANVPASPSPAPEPPARQAEATQAAPAETAPAATASAVAPAPEAQPPTSPVETAAAVAPAGVSVEKTAARTRAEKPVHESSASSPSPERESSAAPEAKPETTTAAATAPAATSTAVVEPRGPVGTEPFDVAAARSALEMSAEVASSCRKDGDPSGVAVVTITFSQTGRVTTATISGPPFQATPTGGCIASTLRKTRVPPFAGDMVTVRKTVTIQ